MGFGNLIEFAERQGVLAGIGKERIPVHDMVGNSLRYWLRNENFKLLSVMKRQGCIDKARRRVGSPKTVPGGKSENVHRSERFLGHNYLESKRIV